MYLSGAIGCLPQNLAVDLVAGKNEGKHGEVAVKNAKGVELNLIPQRFLLDFIFIMQFIYAMHRLIKKNKGHTVVIHTHGIWDITHVLSSFMAFLYRVPLIVSPRGMLMPLSMEIKSVKKKLAWVTYERFIIKRCAGFLVTSEDEFQSVRRISNKPIAVIPNGVPLPITTAGKQLYDENEKLVFGETKRSGEKVLLYLSRLHPQKNIESLLKAWSSLKSQKMLENWRLYVVGPGSESYRRELISMTVCDGCQTDITFFDEASEEEKQHFFDVSSAFILPSYSENFGISVAEAMINGMPIIATTGTPWEIISEKRIGWYVAPDSEAIAGALKSLQYLSDKEIEEYGERARTFALENFQWNIIGEKVSIFYRFMFGDKEDKPLFIRD